MDPEQDKPESAPNMPPSQGDGGSQDFVLNLNFVPTWAREAADKNPYGHHQGGDRDDDRRRDRRPHRDDRRKDPRNRREGGGGGGGGQGRGGPRPFGGGAPNRGPGMGRGPGQGRGPRDFRDRDGDRRGPSFAPPPRLPIEVSFIPERLRLGAIVKQLHASRRAYPLAYLATLFLNKPEHHIIKLEVRGGDLKLHQARPDGAVFLDAEGANAHLLATQMESQFVPEDVQVDPPAGNFVVVGRCRLSGVLLGPPNYHGYQEKLLELHRTRYSHMSIDAYRGQIEMVRDPALIEQWKEQSRTQRIYRAKDAAEGAPTLKRSEAEAQFMAKLAPGMVSISQRVMMPGQAAAKLQDGGLKRVVQEAWNRENRFPLKLMLALRPAFKRMRLHLFKAGRETFVTAIPPKPLDAGHAIENIRQIVALLQDHPGWTRKQLGEQLCPGAAPESQDVSNALSPLRWLIDKGHVIEFFNGTLSLPGHEHHARNATQKSDAAPLPLESHEPHAEMTLPETAVTTPAQSEESTTEPVNEAAVEPAVESTEPAAPVIQPEQSAG